jgi:predicted nucleic acid-binding protein
VIILDTNVISEVLRPVPSKSVLTWLAAQQVDDVFTTSITLAETLFGLARLPSSKRRTELSTAVEKIFDQGFPRRILPFDVEAARAYATLVAARSAAGRTIPQSDAMIAAIARSLHASVATRNTRDFEGCGIRLVNPWKA